MTAEEEICSVLGWAQRTGHVKIAAALSQALARWPVAPQTNRKRRRG
jgi:hypothetical protein